MIDYYTYIDHKQKLILLYKDRLGIWIEGEEYRNSSLRSDFDQILALRHNPDKYYEKLYYNHFFLNQLSKIKTHSEKNFKRYLQRFKNLKGNIAYYGDRFEIFIYSRLIDKEISFTVPKKHPDFNVNGYQIPLFIECGSVQIEAAKDIERSIKSKVEKKGKMNYAKLDTLLLMNVTDSFYKANQGKLKMGSDKIKMITEESAAKYGYGGIALIFNAYAVENGINYGIFSPALKGKHEKDLNLLINDIFSPIPNKYTVRIMDSI